MNISKRSVFLKKKADLNNMLVQLRVEQGNLMGKANPSDSVQARLKELRAEIKKLDTQLIQLCKQNQ